MKKTHLIASCLIIALGVAHVGFANFSNFTERSLWFVGAGLAAIFGGFLNLVFARAGDRDRTTRVLCHAANVLLAAFFIVGAILTPRPQAFCALGLVLVIGVSAALMHRSPTTR